MQLKCEFPDDPSKALWEVQGTFVLYTRAVYTFCNRSGVSEGKLQQICRNIGQRLIDVGWRLPSPDWPVLP